MIFDSHQDGPTLTISNISDEQGSGPMNILPTRYTSDFPISVLWKVKFLTAFDAIKHLPIGETSAVIYKIHLS